MEKKDRPPAPGESGHAPWHGSAQGVKECRSLSLENDEGMPSSMARRWKWT